MTIDQSFGIIPIVKEGNSYTFLLIQHNEGHWAFPKGHANSGESHEQTAKREFFEETGISEVKIIGKREFSEHYTFKSKTGELIKKTVCYFIGFINSENQVKIQPEEVQSYRWCSFKEAYDLITFKPGKEMLSQAKEYLDREWIKEIILKDPWMMNALKAVQQLNLPDSWVGAGFVRKKFGMYYTTILKELHSRM